MEATAERWGVVIESILLKDITYVHPLLCFCTDAESWAHLIAFLRFAEELQTLLSSAATQKRIGESKVRHTFAHASSLVG
jgi:hypothetical protein